MKRSLAITAFFFFVTTISYTSEAKVTGECSNCHTMHNSQGGQPMATYGSSNPEGAGTGPNVQLLRGTCFGCHAQMTGEYVVTMGSSKIPQVYHDNPSRDLAGGNFAYVTGAKGDQPLPYTSCDIECAYDAKGHNVRQLGDEEGGFAEDFPPGDQHDTGITRSGSTALTCAGTYGCHGDRTVTGDYAAISGAHHADDSTIDGLTVGTSFRFLKGVLGLENNGGPGCPPWQDPEDEPACHNEYKGSVSPGISSPTEPAGGTMSGFCAECHGYYHGDATNETGAAGGTPWRRHPTDTILQGTTHTAGPVVTDSEYYYYQQYNTVAPVARDILPTVIDPNVVPGTDIVMCLSCHGAHATNYFKLMRWDYRGWPGGTNGCAVCHTTKD